MAVKIPGIEVVSSDDRVTVHRLADGSTLPITDAPMENGSLTSEGNRAAGIAGPLMKAFATLNEARRTAAGDLNLSDVGKKQKIAGPHQAAQLALSAAESQLAEMNATATQMHTRAYAVPALQADDYNGGLIDQEIRAHVRNLPADQRGKYLESIKTNPRHIEAIMRSPVPIPVASELAERMHVAALERSPAAVQARKYGEAAKWAAQTVSTLKSKI